MAENEKNREPSLDETPKNVEAESKETVKVEEQEKKPEKKKATPPNGTAKVW